MGQCPKIDVFLEGFPKLHYEKSGNLSSQTFLVKDIWTQNPFTALLGLNFSEEILKLQVRLKPLQKIQLTQKGTIFWDTLYITMTTSVGA